MIISTKEYTESDQQTQESSNCEIFKQVADFVGQAQLATLSMGARLMKWSNQPGSCQRS